MGTRDGRRPDDPLGEAPVHAPARRSVRDLPAAERPRERLALRGPGGLSAAELLAIVLGTGAGGRGAIEVAEDVLGRHAGLAALARATDGELAAIPGVGAAKAARLAAAFELGRRSVAERPAGRWTIRSPRDVGGPPARRDGPPRARGAPGAEPQREERRPARVDGLRGQRLRVAGAGGGAVPRPRPARRVRRRPVPQPPVRRPDAEPRRPPPHRRGHRRRAPARRRRPRPRGDRPRRLGVVARPGRDLRPDRAGAARGGTAPRRQPPRGRISDRRWRTPARCRSPRSPRTSLRRSSARRALRAASLAPGAGEPAEYQAGA